ncbi:hypothetical protein [Spirosoma foliorum]|uniref:hypothetical protein n=1 Tax=Spirosoma foliorum TaxID=2710596 RepID=UPI001F0A637B|nr:hypothetical protein [Spirosoma foliorum]
MKQSKSVMHQMVAAVLLGQLNIDQTAERYKVNRLTVLRWIRKIEEEAKVKKQAASTHPDLLSPFSRKSTRASTPEDQVNQLRAKVRSLEEELETANFKTLYYSTLVPVAKHELGVDIKKSPLPSHPVYADELSQHFDSAVRECAWFSRQAYYQYWQR